MANINNYNLISPIFEAEFDENVKVKFKDINDGFDKFKSKLLTGLNLCDDKNKFLRFIELAYDLNGTNNTYVDFYYHKLNDDEKLHLISELSDSELSILNQAEKFLDGNTVYYKLNTDMLRLIAKLCTDEILFSTIYFTKYECTLWSNYDLKFPLFYTDADAAAQYEALAKSLGLNII